MAKEAISGSFDCVVTPSGRSVFAQDDRVKTVRQKPPKAASS